MPSHKAFCDSRNWFPRFKSLKIQNIAYKTPIKRKVEIPLCFKALGTYRSKLFLSLLWHQNLQTLVPDCFISWWKTSYATRVFPRNLPVRSRMVSLQSNSHPGNKISACKYLREGRTIQPRLRDRVVSSVKWISFRMFLTSLNGAGMPSNFFLEILSSHPDLKAHIQKYFVELYNSIFHRILLVTSLETNFLFFCCYSYSKQPYLRWKKNKCNLWDSTRVPVGKNPIFKPKWTWP